MGEPISTDPRRTYVAIILDKSGSMQSCKAVTVRGFNEHIQTLQAVGHKGGETFASLVLFSDDVQAEFFNAPVFALRELTEEAYGPTGSTAMYDAVGYTLERLERETDINDPNNVYLVILISDGEENASKHYNASRLSEKVQGLLKTDHWTFTYVGSNVDLSKVQAVLQTAPGNVYKGWNSMNDASSVQQMASGTASLDMFYSEREGGSTKSDDFYKQGTP